MKETLQLIIDKLSPISGENGDRVINDILSIAKSGLLHPTPTVSAIPKPTGEEIVTQIFPYIDEKLRASDLRRLYNCIDSAIEQYASQFRTPAPEGEKELPPFEVWVHENYWADTNMLGAIKAYGRKGSWFPEYSIEQLREIYNQKHNPALSTTPAQADSVEEIIESLRNSFYKETGKDIMFNAGSYFIWLENKIAEYRQYSDKPKEDWVSILNTSQQSGKVHPYTCDRKHENCEVKSIGEDYSKDGVLLATKYGWICPCGKYTQPLPTPPNQ